MYKVALIFGMCISGALAHGQDRLTQEIQDLKKQTQVQAEQIEQIEKQLEGAGAKASGATSLSDTQLGGYGEMNYNQYSKEPHRNQMDLRRAVLFLGHRFDDQISFFSEMEWEHAVVSASDKGETEIEQAYLNWRFSETLTLKAGLFLMPFGFLNEAHEPPVFYGVERNEVETRIIPSTWREGGIGVFGSSEVGIDWGLGLVTGFDIAKLDDAKAPLAATHQELQLAKARDFAVFATLNHRIPGFVVGTSLFSGQSTQGDADFKADNSKPSFAGIDGRVTLVDLHGRWQPRGWDIEALFAKGFIGESNQFNDTILAYNGANPKSPRPFVPEEFYGWLVQVAHKFSLGPVATLSPFLRYEEFNTQAKMSSGIDADPTNRDRVTTVGLSYHPIQQVVGKADYQSYATNSADSRFNLGIGYMF